MAESAAGKPLVLGLNEYYKREQAKADEMKKVAHRRRRKSRRTTEPKRVPMRRDVHCQGRRPEAVQQLRPSVGTRADGGVAEP